MKSYKYLNPLFQILTLTISIAISTITLHAQVPNYVPTNGLVGYWPFNGNAIDESGNGNNGTLGNTISVSDRFGNPNGAYYMNDSKITLGNTFHVQSNQSYTFLKEMLLAIMV